MLNGKKSLEFLSTYSNDKILHGSYQSHVKILLPGMKFQV